MERPVTKIAIDVKVLPATDRRGKRARITHRITGKSIITHFTPDTFDSTDVGLLYLANNGIEVECVAYGPKVDTLVCSLSQRAKIFRLFGLEV